MFYLLKVDLDLGNYERFLDVTLTRDNNITTGKIYQVNINILRSIIFRSILSSRTCSNHQLFYLFTVCSQKGAERRLSWKNRTGNINLFTSRSHLIARCFAYKHRYFSNRLFHTLLMQSKNGFRELQTSPLMEKLILLMFVSLS